MLDHVIVTVSNFTRSIGFYEQALKPPLSVVRIECQRCGRAGRYRCDGLVARFGRHENNRIDNSICDGC
jgi:hypothetical protein